MRIEPARGAAQPRAAAVTARRPSGFLRQSKRILGRDWPVAYLFAGPLMLLLFGLIGYPLLYALWMSFNNLIGIRNTGFVGLQQYQNLWSDDFFRRSVQVTVKFAVISVFLKLCVGTVAALLLHRKGRFRSIFTGLVLLPWVIPEVVAALTWRGIYDPVFGGLNMLLLSTGIIKQGISWTGDPNLALPAMIGVNVWKGIPFFTIILLAGLKSIPADLYDAAAVDGANGWQRFQHVTVPGLRYVIIVACLLSLIFTLNAFGLVFLITGGGPGGATRLFSILAYEYAFSQLRFSSGVAVAMALVPLLLVLVVILGRYMRSDPSSTEGGEGLFARMNLAIVGRVIGGLLLLALLWYMFGLQGALILAAIGVALYFAAAYITQGLEAVSRSIRRVATGGDTRREGSYSKLTGTLGNVGAYVVLGALLLFELFPFYWVIIIAFKTDEQIRNFRSIFWPDPWTTEHFRHMLTATSFPTWFGNTVQVTVVSVFLSVLVGALGAYALVRLRWRGAGFISTAILFAYLMPSVMLVIPLYRILTNLHRLIASVPGFGDLYSDTGRLHTINGLGALMISYPTFGLPFACWLLMGYYRSIPQELEEAALIDGCNYIQAFFRIILPLTLPALLTVALFAVTGAFNEFLFAYIFVRPEQFQTLPVGLAKMVIGDIFPWGKMFAASIMTTIPVVIIYTLAQRFMVEGLTAGSVKG